MKMVNIGCKTPHGLVLQLVNKVTGSKQTFKIAGNNAKRIVGGYGLTEVPEDFANEWFAQNAWHPAVLNGSLFINGGNAKDASAQAKDGRNIETGLEARDPLKAGVMGGEDGEIDKAAVRAFQSQVAQNPVRNAQIQE